MPACRPAADGADDEIYPVQIRWRDHTSSSRARGPRRSGSTIACGRSTPPWAGPTSAVHRTWSQQRVWCYHGRPDRSRRSHLGATPGASSATTTTAAAAAAAATTATATTATTCDPSTAPRGAAATGPSAVGSTAHLPDLSTGTGRQRYGGSPCLLTLG